MFGLFKKSKTVDQIAQDIDAGGSLFGGKRLSAKEALQVTTVLACADAIAETVSVPDLHLMKDLGDGKKEKALKDPVYRVLHRRPNEFQTAMEFRHQITVHAALTGTGIAIPVYDGKELIELIPTTPEMRVWDMRSRYDTRVSFHDEFGSLGTFKLQELFVIRNISWDRYEGLPAIKFAQSAISLAMSAETNISNLQSKGGRPSGIISTENKLTPEARNALVSAFKRFQSKREAFGTAVLDNGMKYYPMGMSAVDQQTTETRRFQVEEICRAMRVFPAVVGFSDKTAAQASTESFFGAHNRLTGNRWRKAWIESADEFLLDGGGPQFVEFDTRDLRGASLKDTGEYYYKAQGSGNSPGWMTPNEIRAEQGLPPIAGGDVLFQPQTQEDAGDAGDDDPASN